LAHDEPEASLALLKITLKERDAAKSPSKHNKGNNEEEAVPNNYLKWYFEVDDETEVKTPLSRLTVNGLPAATSLSQRNFLQNSQLIRKATALSKKSQLGPTKSKSTLYSATRRRKTTTSLASQKCQRRVSSYRMSNHRQQWEGHTSNY
jgi:hypothetical protein